jgi:hypothetical protein
MSTRAVNSAFVNSAVTNQVFRHDKNEKIKYY